MRVALFVVAIALATSRFACGEQIVAEIPIGGGSIAIRNVTDSPVSTNGLDIVSTNSHLVPVPGGFNDNVSEFNRAVHGDLTADARPFEFMLFNLPNQATYGSRGPVTFPAGSCTELTVGVEPNAEIHWHWGGVTPVSGPVDFVATTCAVPEPNGFLLLGFGIIVVGMRFRARR